MNLYQQPGLSNLIAENWKWAWHLNLFSMTRVNKKVFEDDVIFFFIFNSFKTYTAQNTVECCKVHFVIWDPNVFEASVES